MSGLKRIILIATHLPGVVELKLDGHTNICGTNASGKTTLQRLLPVFYGEYPSRVVPATRDSFERWYLRTETSYIIYEYQRADGELSQVILSSSGRGVDYRLVGKGFELRDYAIELRSGEHKVIAPVELSRKFKRDGFTCSRQLNTREFRAIIQNDRTVLSTSRDLPNYAATFSMAESGQNLRHIEKLAKAVHSKEGKMDTIRSMIAAILEEDGITPPINTIKLNAVENWIKERKLIKNFAAIRPEFTKLQQAHDEYQSNDIRLSQLQQQYKFDVSTLAKETVEQETALEEIQLQSKQLERDWEETRTELNNALSVAKSDVQTHTDNLDKLEKTYDDWQDQGIDALTENVQALPSWKSELTDASEQLNLLTKEHQDVEAAYEKRLRGIESKHSKEMDGLNNERQAQSDQLSEQKQNLQQQESAIEKQFQQQMLDAKEEYQERLNTLKIQHTKLNTLLANVGFTEQEQQQLDLLEARIAEAADAEDICKDKYRDAQHARNQVRENQAQATRKFEQAERDKQAAQQAVEKVEALLFPGHSTLLEYLRRQHPEWADSIGKVINPDLLNRSDLKPESALGDSLYGVSLDLLSIGLPESAQSETELQSQLDTAQAKRDEALDMCNQAESALADLSNTLREADTRETRARTEASNAEQNRRRLQKDKDLQLEEFRQARSERKQTHKKQLKENHEQQQKVLAQQQQTLDQIKDDMHEASLECRSHWQMIIGDIELKIAQIDDQKAKSKDSAKLQTKQCKSWFKDELAKRDVDVDLIGKLKEKVESLRDNIADAELNRDKVSDYQYWYKQHYTDQKITWQKQLNDAKKRETQASSKLQKEQESYQQNRSLNDEKQLRIERQLRECKERFERLNSVQRLLSKVKLPATELQPSKDNLTQRISEGQQLLGRRETLQSDIKSLVEYFDSQIASQSGSGLANIWEKSREECMFTNEQDVRTVDHIRLVSHLDQLLNIHVPQHLTTIKEDGRIFGKNLAEYYKILKEIEAHIGRESNRISREVDEELFLDGVSDSAVKIRSRIAELDFWDDLQDFSKHYIEWMEQGGTELPNEDYVQSMRTVLDILGRSAIEGGIAKLLDIELHIHEGDSDLIIRTDRQLNESSSHGMAYLILCKFLLAFTRLLRGKTNATIHWPIDELGTLHQTNIKKIFDACQNNNILVLGAFPNPESEVLTLFENRYLIANKDGQRRLQVVQPKISPIAERLKQRQTAKQDTNEGELA